MAYLYIIQIKLAQVMTTVQDVLEYVATVGDVTAKQLTNEFNITLAEAKEFLDDIAVG